MANITVFLSDKVKGTLGVEERLEMLKQISDKVEKDLDVKANPTLASSSVSGPEVSVILDDIGNINGAKGDILAWEIKSIIIGFILLRRVLLIPSEVRIEMSLRTVN